MANPALAAFKKGIAGPDFNAPAPVISKDKIKADIIAESGISIAKPKGISTIAGVAGTPFVPPQPIGTLQNQPQTLDNAWTRTLTAAGQPTSPNALPPVSAKLPPAPPTAVQSAVAAPIAGAAATTAADKLATNSGLKQAPIRQSIAGPLVMLDGNKGLGDTSAISNRVDWSPGSANVRAGIADVKYNEEVDKANQFNTAQKDMLANRGIAQRFNDLSSGNTTWSMPKDQKLSIASTEFATAQKGIADDKELTGRKYTADQSLTGTKYTADQSAQTHKYSSDQALAGQKYTADQKKITDELELQQRVKTALQSAVAKGALTEKDIVDGAHSDAYKSATELMKNSMTADPAERQKEFDRYYHDARLKFLTTYKQMTAGVPKS